jgi:hexosaminidase
MKNLMFLLFSVVAVLDAHSQNIQQEIAIIPMPVSLQQGTGSFQIKSTTSIEINSGTTDAKNVAQFLSDKLKLVTGYALPVKEQALASKIGGNIMLALIKDAQLGDEGYQLEVTPSRVFITANTSAGLFYGVQTLYQLLPKQVEGKQKVENILWSVPAVTITDYPRFKWRGLMLDVTRHFFTKEEVKSFIDNMVMYKYNLLHLHLSDDQGWRLEIKSLPKLTEVGAWRVTRKGKYGNTKAPDPSEPKDYGGYYTHEDIRELVQYAKDRFVNILPEIDVPGHSMAAIASYPELTCTPGTYRVNAGEKFMEWHAGGKFSALVDNNLCPAKEEVYVFLDKVFTEVAELFPFAYIHMGGDEAAKNFWEKSSLIKTLMQKEKLKDMHEVQSYFVKRVEKIIQSKGKKLIGWDEILEGGLAPNATVMSWRGMKGGIEAAKQGHQVVMSPADFVYLDYMQGDPITEPRIYASLRLNKTYQFDPVPQGVDPNLILGGQGNLWTEHIHNMRTLQYMLWPRGLAVAESVWSPKEKKNWSNFIQRVERQMERLDEAEIKYASTMYEPIFAVKKEGNNIRVTLTKEIDDIDLHYSWDESHPDKFYPKYTAPLIVPQDAVTLKIASYKNGKQIGRQLNMPVEELKKRAGIK